MITGRGKEVEIKNTGLDVKEEFYQLKDGDSFKVRLLSTEDYVGYKSHNEFALGVYPTPCNGSDDCVYCKASTVTGYTKLKVGDRFLFAFADLSAKKVKLFDATPNQAKQLVSQLTEYEDNINDICFNFKRVGKGKDTVYTLNPVLKMSAKEQEVFDAFSNIIVDDSFFEDRLLAKKPSDAFCVKLLMDKGFPVEDFYSETLVADAMAIGKDQAVTPVDSTATLKDLV